MVDPPIAHGKWSLHNSPQLIVYEPEAASLSAQVEICESPGDARQLAKGDRYFVLDLGGGTADIACHQIIDKFKVKEAIPPSGGPWGSSYIDEAFVDMATLQCDVT